APPSRDPEAEQKNFRQNENQVGPAVTFNRPNGRLAGQFFLRKRRTSNRERRIYLWSKGYTRLFSPSERHWFMCRSVVLSPQATTRGGHRRHYSAANWARPSRVVRCVVLYREASHRCPR